MAEVPIPFSKFTAISDWCCSIIGMQPYEERPPGSGFDWKNLMFLINVFNINFWAAAECIFIYMSIKSNTNAMEVSLTTSFLSVIFIANFKVLNIQLRKKTIIRIMHDIRSLYPLTLQDQRDYKVKEVLKKYNMIHFPYLGLHVFIVWAYSGLYITMYFISWLQGSIIERPFPYFIWLPWDWRDTWFYYFAYIVITYGAFVYYLAQATADGVMYICITQVTMHFEYLQYRILNYVPKPKAGIADMKFLSFVIERHNTLLELTERINKVCGLQLFVNIMISTIIVCFGAFQVLNDDKDIAWLVCLYLSSVFSQVFIISLYSHYLIQASERFTSSIYSHQWYDADIRYKRMLPLIMQRAQMPPMLMATNIFPISLNTVTVFVQTSYKFLALLQTLYGD